MTDSIAGESLTIPGSANSASFIRAINHHDDEPRLAPEDNRIPKRSLPLTRGPRIGPPDAVNPLGRGFATSLEGGGAGAGE